MLPSTWWQWVIFGAIFALALLQEFVLLPRADREEERGWC
jgi:hypothetical protein